MTLAPMAHAKTVAVTSIALICAVAPAAVATASAQSEVTMRASAPTFRFNFDNGESLKAGTRVKDATGHGHFGVVRVSGNGHLTPLKSGVTGRAAGFPRACSTCGRAIITIASKPELNPGKGPFSFGSFVRATPKQAQPHRDPNIVMKGATQKGKYKLHLLGARPRCVFAGAANEVILTSPDPIDTGTWHRVVCSRNGKLHQLSVDGKLKDSSNNAYSGSITSSDPVKVGGRAVGAAGSNDQFHGDLDNVFLHIAR